MKIKQLEKRKMKAHRTNNPSFNPSNPFWFHYCPKCDVYIGWRPKSKFFNCPYCGTDYETKEA